MATEEKKFYTTVSGKTAKCSYIRKSSNYADNFSGMCRFVEKTDKGPILHNEWVNFAHGEIGDDTELGKCAPFDVLIQELVVSPDADPELLAKYNMVVGQIVIRAYII